jgi:hypothetical protein
MEGLLENARDLGRLADCCRPFRYGFNDRFNVDCLEVFFVQARARRLADNAQDWD